MKVETREKVFAPKGDQQADSQRNEQRSTARREEPVLDMVTPALPVVVAISGVFAEWYATGVTPGSPKQPAHIEMRVGGCAAHFARVARARGLASAVVGAQSPGLARLVTQALRGEGIESCLICRLGSPGAVTMVLPTESGGQTNILVQRLALRAADLAGLPETWLRCADVVVVGPQAPVDAKTIELLERIGRMTNRGAVRVLFPSAEMVTHRYFKEMAWLFDYVQMNAEEAQSLDAGKHDPLFLLSRLKHLLGGRIECAITNGANRGWLWAQQRGLGWRWYPIDPPAATVVCELGAGYAWAAEFLIQHRWKGVAPAAAVVAANETAWRWVSGLPL